MRSTGACMADTVTFRMPSTARGRHGRLACPLCLEGPLMVDSHAGVSISAANDPLFGLTIRFSTSAVIVGVRGELDLLTAPGLTAMINALDDAGHSDVVVDLLTLDFMDAAGLRVMAAGSARLRRSGGSLTIRSPSSMVRRILDLTGMLDLVESDAADPQSLRSEERRVGKECDIPCRSRWSPYH